MSKASPQAERHRQMLAAIAQNDEATVAALLDQGVSPNVQRGHKGLLARALEHEDPRIALRLIDAGAAWDGPGVNQIPWLRALGKHGVPLLRRMMAHGAPLHEPLSSNGHTALGWLAVCRREDALMPLLEGVHETPWAKPPGVQPGARAETLLGAWWAHRPKLTQGPHALRDTPELPSPQWWAVCHRLLEQTPAVALQAHAAEELLRLPTRWVERLWPLVQRSPWWTPRFRQVAFNLAWSQPHTQALAQQMWRDHGPTIPLTDCQQHGPWTRTALATVLYQGAQAAKKAPQSLAGWVTWAQALLDAGASLAVRQNGWSLWAWAAHRERVPMTLLQVLLRAGQDPAEPIAGYPKGQARCGTDDQEVETWAGSTVLHQWAWFNQTEPLAALLAQHPQLADLRDAHGYTPLMRVLLPPAYAPLTAPQARARHAWSTVQVLLSAGADPALVTPRGNGLLHLAAAASHHQLLPQDIEPVISGLVQHHPALLEQCNEEGVSGRQALHEDPTLQALAGVIARQDAEALERTLTQERPILAAPVRRPRL